MEFNFTLNYSNFVKQSILSTFTKLHDEVYVPLAMFFCSQTDQMFQYIIDVGNGNECGIVD